MNAWLVRDIQYVAVACSVFRSRSRTATPWDLQTEKRKVAVLSRSFVEPSESPSTFTGELNHHHLASRLLSLATVCQSLAHVQHSRGSDCRKRIAGFTLC